MGGLPDKLRHNDYVECFIRNLRYE